MVNRNTHEWFAAEVLVHESALRGYLTRFLQSAPDVSDVVQETYAKLLALNDTERARITSPHAFLFTTARNVALDRLRRQRVVSLDLLVELDDWDVLNYRPALDEELNTRQELAQLADVIRSLPERCRQVLTLRKLYGMPQKEIARRLGISEHTVEKHVANGVRFCAERMLAAREREAHERATDGRTKPHEHKRDVE